MKQEHNSGSKRDPFRERNSFPQGPTSPDLFGGGGGGGGPFAGCCLLYIYIYSLSCLMLEMSTIGLSPSARLGCLLMLFSFVAAVIYLCVVG